jgi:hypothetical protein
MASLRLTTGLIVALVACAITTRAYAEQQTTLRSDAAIAEVIATDEAWAKAEQNGDVAAVEDLLLPGYRSVGSDGKVHDRNAILANTRRNRGSDLAARRVAEWTARHPTVMSVTVNGDTAVLTFAPKPEAEPATVLSCDVFVRIDGRWHAIYSQHSTAEGT